MFSFSWAGGRLADLPPRIASSGAPMPLYPSDSTEALLTAPQDYALRLAGMGIRTATAGVLGFSVSVAILPATQGA